MPRVTEISEDEEYDWIVRFSPTKRKYYTYTQWTVKQMQKALADSYARDERYPYRVWIVLDGEMIKVDVA